MSFQYPSFKTFLLTQALSGDITGLNIKCALIDTGTYTPSVAHDYLNDLSGIIATSGNVTSITATTEGTKTSGSLVVGRAYIIESYQSGDDFTNVGASSNATGEVFVATGTTPTTWTNSSQLGGLTTVLDCADFTVTGVSGNSIEAVVFYVDTGVASTSPLISFIDGLSLTPDGGNIDVTVNSIANL